METFLDVLGQTLWVLMFVTPLITIPIAWKLLSDQRKIARIMIGLGLAIVFSFFFYFTSLEILFRNGMGPDSR